MSESEELQRKQRGPLICMVRMNQPSTLKLRELLKSVFTQLHMLGLMEQEPLQDPVEEQAKIWYVHPVTSRCHSLGESRHSVNLWEGRRGNTLLIKETIRVINFCKEF